MANDRFVCSKCKSVYYGTEVTQCWMCKSLKEHERREKDASKPRGCPSSRCDEGEDFGSLSEN